MLNILTQITSEMGRESKQNYVETSEISRMC